MKKEYGGLGIPNARDLNLALLGSWVKRFVKEEGKIWQKIVHNKYLHNVPNIFCSSSTQASTFWKGVLWAAKALKFGYKWHVGNGKKVRFWEDNWFGNAPLTVQFWDLFCICDQKGVTLSEVWDGSEVKLTFRRTFTEEMITRWFELIGIVEGVCLSEEGDSLVWQYESNGIYSTQSLYAVINFRGVQPVFVPAVWNIKVPPKIQVFHWLLSNNKLMTIDNLAKRGVDKPKNCRFCDEIETINHLFFQCVVAKKIWAYFE